LAVGTQHFRRYMNQGRERVEMEEATLWRTTERSVKVAN